MFLEDIASNSGENPDFVVTPSTEANILIWNHRSNPMSAQNHSRKPNICTKENYLQNYNSLTVPGNSYATVSNFGGWWQPR